jgi:hypothetical protein
MTTTTNRRVAYDMRYHDNEASFSIGLIPKYAQKFSYSSLLMETALNRCVMPTDHFLPSQGLTNNNQVSINQEILGSSSLING